MDTQAKVITVTLNPSLDRTLVTHFLTLGYHNRTTETSRLDPAGRGMGIARALHSLGIQTQALVLLGNDATGRAYEALLAEEAFPISVVHCDIQTRSRVIIRDTGHDTETHVFEEGVSGSPGALQAIADLLPQLVRPGDRVVFAGSLPEGVPPDTYAWLTDVAQGAGAYVAINAGGGDALLNALKANPDLVYLTQLQAERLFNIPVRVQEDIVYCAQQLREQGAKAVLIAMSQTNEVLLVTDETTWSADCAGDAVGTQSGRAEAMIAGYLAGRIRQGTREKSLELGAAAVAYTMSQVGHEFGSLAEIRAHLEDITIVPVDNEGV